MTIHDEFWDDPHGRELDATPLDQRALPHRLVACLNVWNDRKVLESTVPSWKDFVDHVIVVDGSYGLLGEATLSTDGTREYLASVFPSIEFIDLPGASQCEKRTAYLAAGLPDDYLFVIDADERLVDGDALAQLPACDIGWVRMQSPIYTREYDQPRIFRWRPYLRYEGRHHWMYYGKRLFCTHQYGGTGFQHRVIPIVLMNDRSYARSSDRLRVKSMNLRNQHAIEASLCAIPQSAMSDAAITAREALRITNYAFRDDGLAPSRFHTAINRTTPHSSIMFKLRKGPFEVPEQYIAGRDNELLSKAVLSCDVIHVHSMNKTRAYPPQRRIPLVLHHHGSRLRENAPMFETEAKIRKALVLVANLELLSWTGDYPAEFLPNAMPVARYKALADLHRHDWDGNVPFRIAHSPSHRAKKGTELFLDACDRLIARGYPLQPVVIEDVSHGQALLIKATCHAMFDSFWLGMQCSGLEAASMQMPVIAGDETVAERYRQRFGHVPYTFADSSEAVEDVLVRLMEDTRFYHEEAERVYQYVEEHHDESAVALLYLDLLDREFQWRSTPRSRLVSQRTGRFFATR